MEDGPAGLGSFEVQAGGLGMQHIYGEIELMLATLCLDPIGGRIAEAGFIAGVGSDLC